MFLPPNRLSSRQVAPERRFQPQRSGPARRRRLCYGDIITLFGPDDQGWLSASTSGRHGAARLDHLASGVTTPPNLRDCRFQVHPQYRCSSQQLHARRSVDTRILEAEDKAKRLEFAQCFGDMVLYGATIQLQSVEFELFLTQLNGMSRIDRDAYRVELSSGSVGSWWKVVPVYKFRHIGHPVVFEDSVYLQSPGDHDDTFLHVSDTDLSDSVVSLSRYCEYTFEVNSSIQSSRWQIMPYRDGKDHVESESLRGGDVISIFHPEGAAELVVENGNVGWSHFTGESRTTGIWKIEAVEPLWCGEPVMLDPRRPPEGYRLQHIASGLYLCSIMMNSASDDVLPQGQWISTTDTYMNDSCVFYFIPIDDDATADARETLGEKHESLRSGAHLFIRQGIDGFWLSQQVAVGTLAESRGWSSIQRMMASKGFAVKDGSQKAAHLYPEKNPAQHLSLISVASSRTRMIDKARMLKCYVDEAMVTLVNGGRCSWSLLDALQELICLCLDASSGGDPLLCDAPPCDEKQILMRDLDLITSVLQLVRELVPTLEAAAMSSRDGTADPTFYRESVAKKKRAERKGNETPSPALVGQVCYRFLRAAVKDNDKNKMAVQHELALFTKHMALEELQASDLMAEVLKDNREMLSELSDHQILSFLQIYRENRGPRYLVLMQSLCQCHGSAVPFVQNSLTDWLLERRPWSLPSMRMDPVSEKVSVHRGSAIIYPNTMRDSEDCINVGRTDNADELLFGEMVEGINLLASLLYGRNPRARHALVALVTKESDAKWCFSRKNLCTIVADTMQASLIRKACLRLLMNFYIDQEPMHVRPIIRTTYVRKSLQMLTCDSRACANFGKISEDASVEDCATDVLEVMESCIKDVISRLEGGTASNVLIKLAAEACQAFSVLVDFGCLQPGPFLTRWSKCLLRLLEISIRTPELDLKDLQFGICEVFAKLFDLRLGKRISLLIDAYEESYADQLDSPAFTTCGADWTFEALETKLFKTAIISECIMSPQYEHAMDDAEDGHFSQWLRDILISDHGTPELKKMAFRLLARYSSQRAHFICELQHVQILALAESVQWMHEAQGAYSKLSTTLEEIVASNEDAHRQAEAVLIGLKMCHAGEDSEADETAEDEELHLRKYQDILRSVGLHKVVIRILKLPLRREKVLNDTAKALNENRRSLFNECYSFLRFFCQKNPQNQELLFRYCSLFLSHVGVTNLNAADTIAATLRDNRGLCARMTEKHIRQVVQFIVYYGKRARWLRLLENILIVAGRPCIQNQNHVLSCLIEDQDYVLELDGDQGGDDETLVAREGELTRGELMRAREHETGGMQSFLEYHTTNVRLLALCCVGNNYYNQHKCRTLMPLLLVLRNFREIQAEEADEDVKRYVKSAFLLFFFHIYVDDRKSLSFCDSFSDELWAPGGVFADIQMEVSGLLARVQKRVAGMTDGRRRNKEDTMQIEDGAIIIEGYERSSVRDVSYSLDARSESDESRYSSSDETPRLVLSNSDPLHEHIDYVFDLVFPILTKFWKYHDMSPAPENQTKSLVDSCGEVCLLCASCLKSGQIRNMQRLFSEWAAKNVSGHTIKDPENCVKAVEDQFFEVNLEAVKAISVPAQEANAFKSGFKKFYTAFEDYIGVNLSQMIGIGLKSVAQIFVDDDRLIQELAALLRGVNSSEQKFQNYVEEQRFALTALRVLRALFFVESSKNECDPWKDYLRGGHPRWNENLNKLRQRFVNVEVVEAIMESTDPKLCREAFKNLIVLLDGDEGQIFSVQQKIFYHLERTNNRLLFLMVEMLDRFLEDLKIQQKMMLKAKERQSMLLKMKSRRLTLQLPRRGSRKDPSIAGSSDSRVGSSESDKGTSIAGTFTSVSGTHISPSRGSVMLDMSFDNNSAASDSDLEEGGYQETHPKETGHIEEAVLVLHHLCRGRYAQMQNLMCAKESTSPRVTSGLLRFMSKMDLYVEEAMLSHARTRQPLRVILSCFRVLMETIRGPNVDTIGCILSDDRLFNVVNKHLLVAHKSDNPRRFQVFHEIISFLWMLVQGISADNPGWIRTFLNGGLLYMTIAEQFQEILQMYEVAKHQNSDVHTTTKWYKLGLTYFMVLSTIGDFDTSGNLRNQFEESGPAFAHFAKHSTHIEVVAHGRLTRLHFPKTDFVSRIQASVNFHLQVNDILFQSVDADSDQARLTQFFYWVDKTVRAKFIEHGVLESDLSKRGWRMIWASQKDKLQALPLYLSIAINGWLLFIEGIELHYQYQRACRCVFVLLTVFHLLACAARLVHHCDFATDDMLRHVLKKDLAMCGAALLLSVYFSDLFSRALVLLPIPILLTQGAADHYSGFKPHTIPLLGVFVSALGTFASPYFFALHLLEVADTQETKLILKSVTVNVEKLGRALLLICLVVYFYAVIGFTNFQEFHGNATCSTLLNCVITYLDGGITGGGIHGLMKFQAVTSILSLDQIMPFILTLFQQSYFTGIVLVLLAVFSGIIIDSFGQLRDEHANKQQELKTTCFICGLTRGQLERRAYGFDTHIHEDHNTFHYVYFIAYVLSVPAEELSDLEKSLRHQLDQNDISWLPKHNCLQLALHGADSPEVDEAAESMLTVEKHVRAMETQLQDIADVLRAVESKMRKDDSMQPDRGSRPRGSLAAGRATLMRQSSQSVMQSRGSKRKPMIDRPVFGRTQTATSSMATSRSTTLESTALDSAAAAAAHLREHRLSRLRDPPALSSSIALRLNIASPGGPPRTKQHSGGLLPPQVTRRASSA